MACERGQSFVVLKDCGENQCVLLGRNALQGDVPGQPEVVFYPAKSSVKELIKVQFASASVTNKIAPSPQLL